MSTLALLEVTPSVNTSSDARLLTLPTPPVDTTILDGHNTPRVDVSNLSFQANPAFKPDKAHLWQSPESHDGWIHAHNAVRFEIGEMKRVVEALTIAPITLKRWHVDAVQAWWTGHEKHVHEHHTNEDDLFNPTIRTRVVYPEKLEADHVELVAAMNAIAEHVRALQPGDTLESLRALWMDYESVMLPHLHEEEQVGLPLVRAYFTPAEIDKVVATILKRSDPVSLGAFVHVMGHKKEVKLFMKENGIPGFVWHIPGSGFKALRTLYRVRMQSHIDSLLAGEVVESRTKHAAKENAAKAAKVLSTNADVIEQGALSPCKRVNVMSAAHLRSS